ncbi:tetratricopeptide repeat protein [Massilia sp. SYSU DXS3249]
MMRAAVLLALALWSGTAPAQPVDAQAAWRLGLMHRHGTGVPLDAARAAHYIRIAAEQQVPAAMFTLSNMLAAGEGVAKDEKEARRWLEAAAALDYPAALQQLALTEPDPRKAELLMRQAAHALQHRSPGL